MKTNQKTTGSQKRNTKRPQETLKERVHRHLTDINSKITDDDIRNVKTELTVRGETAPETRADNEENKRQEKRSEKQKKENEADSEKKYTTPWNILSEGYD